MALKSLAEQLRKTRERKGLSQRALGERVGLPQSHISKIEAGGVDLQTSSLAELARALDLELVLLPRGALAAIRALTQGSAEPGSKPGPAYQLDDSSDGNG